jgi:amino acid permease
MTEDYFYENTEVKKIGGKKIVRKVSIKNGKAIKMVSKYHKGKHLGTVKKSIHNDHVQMITIGKFVSGLFSDCKCGEKKTKTRKNKRG